MKITIHCNPINIPEWQITNDVRSAIFHEIGLPNILDNDELQDFDKSLKVEITC